MKKEEDESDEYERLLKALLALRIGSPARPLLFISALGNSLIACCYDVGMDEEEFRDVCSKLYKSFDAHYRCKRAQEQI